MIDTTDYIPWDDVCFIDCETRSTKPAPDGDVTKTSTRRYAAQAFPIVITWGYGLDGDVRRWEWSDFTTLPTSDDMPLELLEWGGYFAAWNSAFDRAILNDLLGTHVNVWLDMMVHAGYNNLPLGLDRAAKACGHEGKISIGKTLIKMFCPHDGIHPKDDPDNWKKFGEYADVDITQMQAVAGSSFPVPYAIWEEFWVSERINDRGLPIDTDMAKGGAVIAEAYAAQTNERVRDISDGALYSVRQYDAQRSWVWERVRGNPFVAEHMIVAERNNPDTGEEEFKLKMDRPRITKMIAALCTLDEKEGLTDDEFAVLRFLEEREYGASAAPAKFAKVLDMVMPDGTLPNQYVFGGATQTSRFSSRGVQVHNMTRSTVGDLDAEEAACVYLIEEGEEGVQ